VAIVWRCGIEVQACLRVAHLAERDALHLAAAAAAEARHRGVVPRLVAQRRLCLLAVAPRVADDHSAVLLRLGEDGRQERIRAHIVGPQAPHLVQHVLHRVVELRHGVHDAARREALPVGVEPCGGAAGKVQGRLRRVVNVPCG